MREGRSAGKENVGKEVGEEYVEEKIWGMKRTSDAPWEGRQALRAIRVRGPVRKDIGQRKSVARFWVGLLAVYMSRE